MNQIENELSPEEIEEINQVVQAKSKLAFDNTQSRVKQNIVSMMSGRGAFQENPLKSLTIRLAVADYAKLSVLSSRLNQSPSGLARLLLLDAVSDAITAYLSVKNSGDEFSGENLAEDIREEEERIFGDLSS